MRQRHTIFAFFVSCLFAIHTSAYAQKTKRKSIKNKDLLRKIESLEEAAPFAIALASFVNISGIAFLFWFLRKRDRQNEATIDWLLSETRSALNTQNRHVKKQLKDLQASVEIISQHQKSSKHDPQPISENDTPDDNSELSKPDILSIQLDID